MKIKQHPQDMLTKVGEDAKFFIAVTASSPGQISYNWCFNNQSVSDYNADYKGATTSELVVLKSLSKHCGSYKCIVTHQFSSDVQVPSFSAVLEIGIIDIIYYIPYIVEFFHMYVPLIKRTNYAIGSTSPF